jgi:very-short-patch-repair endonuclease
MGALEQTRGIDDRIVELADGQHGVVARRQLEAGLGMGRRGIEVRLRSGRLHRLHPGVYTVGHRVLSREGRWMAAVLFCGSGAVLSHRSAAALWGIRPPSSRAIEATTRAKSRSRAGIHRHFAVLPADEVTEHDGIPATTVPRTIFDLAAVQPVDVVENAFRQAEYLRLHDRLSLPQLLERYPGRKGSKAIRECLARRREAPGRARSWLEEQFLPFLRRHQLPPPHLNRWLEVGGKSIQVDCLWPEAKAVVELDGFAAHGTRVAFREDRARDRRLRVAGYGVTRIAPEQLEDEPEALAADLRALLTVPNTNVRDNVRA